MADPLASIDATLGLGIGTQLEDDTTVGGGDQTGRIGGAEGVMQMDVVDDLSMGNNDGRVQTQREDDDMLGDFFDVSGGVGEDLQVGFWVVQVVDCDGGTVFHGLVNSALRGILVLLSVLQ